MFHEGESFVRNLVAPFLREALDLGGAGLVIATPARRQAIAEALAANPPDRLRMLDAEETLAGFMVGGEPDRKRFESLVGGAIADLARAGGDLRAYGEMVAVLWARGQRDAAIALERLWNELLRGYSFSLLCAYPSAELDGFESGSALSRVCACHTRVIAERALQPPPPDLAASDDVRALLAAIVDSSDDAIVSKTLQGVVTSWNRGAERIFGYTAQEVVGRSIGIIFPASRGHEEDAILARLQRGEHIEHFETQRRTKDGRIIDVSLSISPVRNSAGEIVGVSKIARDITERIRAEQELRELNATLERRVAERTAQALKQARLTRELAAQVTRTEQRERRKLADLLHDELAQLLALARLNLTRLEAQSSELRSIAELQTVKDLVGRSIEFTRSLLGELVPRALYDAGLRSAVHELAGLLMRQHGLTVIVRGAGEVQLSEDHSIFLFRATRELLTNVIKHAGTDSASVTIEANAGWVTVVVEDEGVGMDPALREVPPGECRGFGLVSLRERAQLLGAEFEIQSRVGEGTRCALRVPSAQASLASSSVTVD